MARQAAPRLAGTLSSRGCVAVHSRTVLPQRSVSRLMALLKRFTIFTGNVCTSSNTSTAPARAWRRRTDRVSAPNSASSTCTIVVKTMGASQFSASTLRRQLSPPLFSSSARLSGAPTQRSRMVPRRVPRHRVQLRRSGRRSRCRDLQRLRGHGRANARVPWHYAAPKASFLRRSARLEYRYLADTPLPRNISRRAAGVSG